MENWITICHLTALVLTVGVYISYNYEKNNKKVLMPRDVVIGVISARDHFTERQAVRETWGSQVQTALGMELVFVLGEEDCHIHPEDRISLYSCNKWDASIFQDIKDSETLTFFKSQQEPYQSNLKSLGDLECFTGLGIRVIHPVIVKTLSVRMDVVEHFLGMYIILQDPEEVIERRLITSEPHSVGNGYYNYRLESPLLLPRGFEGELILFRLMENETLWIGDDFSSASKKKWVCEWTNHSLLEYKYLRSSEGYVTKWTETYCPLIAAEFGVSDKDSFINHMNEEHHRNQEWKLQLDTVERKIQGEQDKFSDIVKVPGIDVYTNLPHKVVGFLKWVTTARNASLILKADDDTFVNIELLKNLTHGYKHDGLAWWSVFHHHHTVPLYGKWSDADYPALAYPAFPAGAGYLMTGVLAQRVNAAAGFVQAYGGEDVSLGIWVAAVAGSTKLFSVPCWIPHTGCSQTVLIPQLTVTQIKEVWRKHNRIL